VRLVELLDEARDRSREAIVSHNKENEEKGRPFIEFTPAELDEAAAIMGYGAVKYADLKNNRQTNYKCAAARRLQALQVTRPGVVVQARACLAHHSSAVYAVRCLHTLRRLHFFWGLACLRTQVTLHSTGRHW